MNVADIRPGRETDERVAEVVFGAMTHRTSHGDTRLDRGTPTIMGDGCPTCGYDGLWDWQGVPQFSTEDTDAWRYLWPKIVEKTGPGIALIWDRDKDAQDVGDNHTPRFRLVTGSDHWSAFETDVHGGVDVEAPTLALCLTRAALALYGEKP